MTNIPQHMDVEKLCDVPRSIRIFAFFKGSSDQRAFFRDHFALFLGSFAWPNSLDKFSQLLWHVRKWKISVRLHSGNLLRQGFFRKCQIKIRQRANHPLTLEWSGFYSWGTVLLGNPACCFVFAKVASKTILLSQSEWISRQNHWTSTGVSTRFKSGTPQVKSVSGRLHQLTTETRWVCWFYLT